MLKDVCNCICLCTKTYTVCNEAWPGRESGESFLFHLHNRFIYKGYFAFYFTSIWKKSRILYTLCVFPACLAHWAWAVTKVFHQKLTRNIEVYSWHLNHYGFKSCVSLIEFKLRDHNNNLNLRETWQWITVPFHGGNNLQSLW